MSGEFDQNSKNYHRKRAFALFLSKYVNLISIAVLVFIFVICFVFILMPKYQKMKSAAEKIDTQNQDRISQLEIYLSRLKNFNKSYKAFTEAEIKRMKEVLPDKNNYEELVVDVEDIVGSRGLVLESISVSSGSEGNKKTRAQRSSDSGGSGLPKGVKEINASLSISGLDYNSFKALLADFERSLRIIDVSELSYDGGEGASFQIKTYYFDL